jgi:hypothetical protein
MDCVPDRQARDERRISAEGQVLLTACSRRVGKTTQVEKHIGPENILEAAEEAGCGLIHEVNSSSVRAEKLPELEPFEV